MSVRPQLRDLRMGVLMLSQGIPFPPFGGGLLRTYHLLRGLTENTALTIIGFSYGEPVEPAPFSIDVVRVPWQWPPLYQQMMSGTAEASREAFERLALVTDEPWFVSCVDSSAMEQALGRFDWAGIDLVVIEGSSMARFLPQLPPGVPTILDLPDVHSLMARRECDRASPEDRGRAIREAERAVRFETWAASRCSLTLTVSEEEAAAARELLGHDRIEIVPNGVDTKWFTPEGPAEQDDRIVFVGRMNYPPNVEAVQYFTGRILPLVQAEFPRAEFHIIGTDPTKEVTDLAGVGGVVVHGRVANLRPHYDQAALVVVPLLHGGGTRLKILEAAACGKPIVATSLAAEGLPFRDGEEVLIADKPGEFARAVVRALSDAGLRSRLGRRARDVSVQYDWERIGSEFRRIAEQQIAAVGEHPTIREASTG